MCLGSQRFLHRSLLPSANRYQCPIPQLNLIALHRKNMILVDEVSMMHAGESIGFQPFLEPFESFGNYNGSIAMLAIDFAIIAQRLNADDIIEQ